MAETNGLQPEIRIEETYACTVTVGDQTMISWEGQQGSVTVIAPYDEKLLNAQLPAQALAIGEIQLVEHTTQLPLGALPVLLPTGADADVEQRMKRGVGMVWQAAYPIEPPASTLISVRGEVFDGADIDFDERPDRIVRLLFGQSEEFLSDLRMRLTFWVPNLLEQAVLGRENHELRDMLLEQESNTQILLANAASEELLAQSMAALANTYGGRVLLGVLPTGEVGGVQEGDRLELAVLRAALRADPPVAFALPEYLRADNGKTVTRITVPASRQGPHRLAGATPRRQGAATILEPGHTRRVVAASAPPYGNLRDILLIGNTADVVIIDARAQPIPTLELGQYISGLVNAQVKHGLVIVRNLPAAPSGALRLPFTQPRGLMQQINDRLDQERQRCTPLPPAISAEFATIEDEQIAIIRAPAWAVPVMLYNDRGYLWNGSVLSEMTAAETLEHTVVRLGGAMIHQDRAQRTHLTYGELAWPLQPPRYPKGKGARATQLTAQDAQYDPQRRAMTWRQVPFQSESGTNGLACALITSLRQSIGIVEGPAGRGAVRREPLDGESQICFEHILASGHDVTVLATHPLLSTLPVRKRTYIQLKLKVRVGDLFLRRRRVALIHFQVPDVAYDKHWTERLTDIRQALADLEFWVERCEELAPQLGAGTEQRALITAIRSKDFFDIRLVGGISYQPLRLERELRYHNQRTDRKVIQSGLLELRIVLAGGAKAAEEITRLQLKIRHLIEQRLDYMRAE